MNAPLSIPELAPNLPEGLPGGLEKYWYPILQSEELPADKPVAVKVLGHTLAAWRDANGRPCVVRDRCPHRSIKLSVGRVLDGELQCVLHGLRFNGKGACTLIPWEQERSQLHDRVGVRAFPAEELGGYIWAYIGDPVAFPPPPLASEVPEELSRPDEFMIFRLPTQVWKANWLLAIDGSDAYHAVVLHAHSQAVEDKPWDGGAAVESELRLADRRVKIVRTSHGVRGVSVDLQGKPLHHGHFTVDVKGDRFSLPCIHTNPIVAAPGAAPYASRLWQFALDEEHTMVVRFLSWRARTDAEREAVKKVYENIALPRLDKVGEEDAWAAEAQGDLVSARSEEFLLSPDEDVVKVRRLIAGAFVAQKQSASRVDVRAGALEYPV